MMGKRFFFVWTLVLLLMSPCTAGAGESVLPAPGEELELNARAAILMDRISGRVLYEHNADQVLPIASTTKVMTALVALNNSKPDERVRASKKAASVGGTSLYLSEGEELPMSDMLLGLMLRSGNDAATAIAEHVAGSVPAFAKMMDAQAKKLSADASFKNPHGLDEEGHAVSARGLAKITCEALKNSEFRALVSRQKATVPWKGNQYDRELTNKNKLLTSYPGATGVKTGFTSKAGRCLVFAAERNGMELVGVVLNCGTWFESAEKLLNYGFESFKSEVSVRAGDSVSVAAVKGGTRAKVNVVAASDLIVPLGPGEQLTLDFEIDPNLMAPIGRNQAVGRAVALVNGSHAGECTLLADEAVLENNYWSALRRVWHLRY